MLGEYRVNKGYTLEKLAEKCNISWRNLHRIENGKINETRFGTIKKLVKALELSDKEILALVKSNDN